MLKVTLRDIVLPAIARHEGACIFAYFASFTSFEYEGKLRLKH